MSSSSVDQDICVIKALQGEALGGREIAKAFRAYPGIAKMTGIMQNLVDLPVGQAADGLSAFLYDRFEECPAATYLHATRVYHQQGPKAALPLTEERMALVNANDYLARHHVTVLRALLRIDDASRFIMSFFENYDGDLWRQPGFAEAQGAAIDRGCPYMLIVTLPKSGSVFLLNTLARGLQAPHTTLSPIGVLPDLIPSRVREMVRGGSVAVEHLWPTAENLDLLASCGIRKIIFHYRDIRQSTLSFVHHGVSDEVTTSKLDLQRQRVAISDQKIFERDYLRRMARWIVFLEQWLDVIDRDDRFEFMVTNFDDLADEHGLFERILDFLAVPRSLFDWSTLSTSKTDRAGHFRKGLKDEWRQVLSSRTQADVDELIGGYPRVSAVLAAVEPA